MTGIFYSVGVGPGDPELITYKATKTIKNSDIIVVPDSGAGKNVALEIAKNWTVGKQIVSLSMPMMRNQCELEQYHTQAAQTIAQLLEEGKQVSFLTLGDPSIYSTAMYLHRKLSSMGYQTKIIPGVPSFCAAAAALNQPLCEGGEPLHILPASYHDINPALDYEGTKVLMKSGKSIEKVKEALEQKGISAVAVERCGMPGEKIHLSLDSLDHTSSYFSIVIAKEEKE